MKPLSYILRDMNMTGRIIIINAVVWLTVTLVNVIIAPQNIAVTALDLPGGLGLVVRPWTLLTYMFTQTDVWHCLFNMLWLLWFGLMLEHCTSRRRVMATYLLSGLGGAVTFIITTLVLGNGQYSMLEGSSAAVMGVVALTGCTIPNHRVNLFLLGNIKVKWVAAATILLFALGSGGNNIASQAAHIGGVVAGLIIAWYQHAKRPRYDKMPAAHTLSSADARAELDELLDKVKRSGYNSLSGNERRRLIELSHNI
ncbi:MAG: rhomboid family intramembrane serine protease [Muribaculaceae bacterium]|nr:rhomboid family intramembrane serine protease [Muribaculaceae bacterium]